MLRLIDATPIPLDELCAWARGNGRTRGLKLHVVYDPGADHPRRIEITPANVNDVEVGRAQPIEAGATYAFDKAYCDYAWWTRLAAAGARFVTRPKTNARYAVIRWRRFKARQGDGFTVIDDANVRLATQGKAKLAIPLRRVRVQRADGSLLTIITNDRKRTAVAIATIYKTRWGTCPRAGGGRAAVPLAQAAPQARQVPRPQRERRPPADHRRHDRLSAVAHRRPSAPPDPARHSLRRTRRSLPVSTQTHRAHRQTTRGQRQQTATQNRTRPARDLLCLTFPGQPCAHAGLNRL